jgi:CNT family concentrative nucleoside transporter
LLGYLGHFLAWTGLSLNAIGINLDHLRLKDIFGSFFSLFAIVMGVPPSESLSVGSLMGTKMVINEFVAYSDLSPMIAQGVLSAKSVVIASFALCGFANFSSVAIQLGGIGAIAPTRKADLASLGIKAMLVGTMASYISASLAGSALRRDYSLTAFAHDPLVGKSKAFMNPEYSGGLPSVIPLGRSCKAKAKPLLRYVLFLS